jgi:hypothetical protein
MKANARARSTRRLSARSRSPNTRSGNWCQLECGHVVQTFGDLRYANGVALCTRCRDGK